MTRSLTRILSTEKASMQTLVISQWTQNLSMISNYLDSKDIMHVKYQGDMNREKRDASVRAFMKGDKATIMLMSLKCGGVGLNLTRANSKHRQLCSLAEISLYHRSHLSGPGMERGCRESGFRPCPSLGSEEGSPCPPSCYSRHR